MKNAEVKMDVILLWQVDIAAASDAVVEAVGPATVQFMAGGAAGQYVGCLQSAGAYLLHVRLGMRPLAGWPRVLHVLPAAADPTRSVLFLQSSSNLHPRGKTSTCLSPPAG